MRHNFKYFVITLLFVAISVVLGYQIHQNNVHEKQLNSADSSSAILGGSCQGIELSASPSDATCGVTVSYDKWYDSNAYLAFIYVGSTLLYASLFILFNRRDNTTVKKI